MVGYAFTASNTVPTTKVGEGQAEVTGYDVSSVHYNLNAADATKIDSITFNLDTAPVAGSTIRVKLVATGSDWYTCTNVGVSVTCDTTSPQAAVSSTNQLTFVVVAALVTLYAWRTPTEQLSAVPVPYTQHGEFVLSAPPPLPERGIYCAAAVGNGKQVFR